MKLPRRRGRRCCGCRRLCDTDRGDKAITLARRRRDVPPAGASIAQRPPQGADLEFEISLLDNGAPPHAGDQLVLADQLPRALDQSGQNIKRAAAHTHRVIVFEQKSLCWNQAEGAERDRAFGRDEIGHLNLAPSDEFARVGIRQLAAANQPTRRRAVTKGRRPSNRDPMIYDNASKPIPTQRTAGMGHEEPFPPPRLNGRCRFT